VVVDDPLLALWALARAARAASSATVVAITGSNGKTTTRSLVASILATAGPTLEPVGNRNNHIGLPLTLTALGVEHRHAALELGMNHLGEIHDLVELARPHLAVITNVSRAHVGPVGGMDAVREAKLEIVDGLLPNGRLVIPAADPVLIDAARARVDRSGEGRRVHTVGETDEADLRVSIAPLDSDGRARIRIEDGPWIPMPAPGRPVALAAALAFAVARLLGVPDPAMKDALARWRPVSGRLELREAAGIRILDDSYNANPDSTRAALDTLRALPVEGRRVAVLGDMRELGSLSASAHRELAGHLEGLDHVVLVGTEVEVTVAALRGLDVAPTPERLQSRGEGIDAVHLPDADAATAHLLAWLGPGDLVLVKGSRGVALDRVVRALLEDGGEG
jgi:UDP-N-acetylmuramoyl-tripeptide--D-alanyl-D-alanine ligase